MALNTINKVQIDEGFDDLTVLYQDQMMFPSIITMVGSREAYVEFSVKRTEDYIHAIAENAIEFLQTTTTPFTDALNKVVADTVETIMGNKKIIDLISQENTTMSMELICAANEANNSYSVVLMLVSSEIHELPMVESRVSFMQASVTKIDPSLQGTEEETPVEEPDTPVEEPIETDPEDTVNVDGEPKIETTIDTNALR